MWENRDALMATSKNAAHETTASAVGVTISYSTFNRLASHMGLKFTAGSNLNAALAVLSEKYHFGKMVAE